MLIIAFVLFVKSAFAQKDTVGLNIPFSNGAVTYEKVYNADKLSQQLLFSNSQLWFVAHYKGPINPIQLEDSLLCRIVAKGSEPMVFKSVLNMALDCNMNYTIQIDAKDGKYRCRIFNIVLQYLDADNKKQYLDVNDMAAALAGGTNATGMNANQLKRAFVAINGTVNNTLALLNKTMTDNDDF